MKPYQRLTVRVAVAAVLLAVCGAFVATAPAAAECLSEEQCQALKTKLGELKQQARALKGEIQELKQAIEATEPGSPEREELKAQLRQTVRELRQLRREEIRPARRRFKNGCRDCE